MKTKNVAALYFAAMVLIIGLCVQTAVSGQEGTTKRKHAAAGKTMTVTGCLQKGDEANEFAITDNGKTYGLRSTKVDLAKHVGHQVSVTGTFKAEGKEEGEENEANEKKEMKEAGDIRVRSLKMIKEGCQ